MSRSWKINMKKTKRARNELAKNNLKNIDFIFNL
uniref:Uncharacterized protein n=1 Tax=Onchocerca volvulus TaxID=6282 RepID=A0A8R1TST0_ONCVO